MTLIGPDGSLRSAEDLRGADRPNLATVDELAHRALAATRAGERLVLDDVEPQLADLLRLSGLSVEMQWQAESREEPLGVEERQEESHLGDPAP